MTQTFRYVLKQNSMTRAQSEQSISSEEKQTKQVSNQTSEASDEKEQQKSLMRGLFGRLFEVDDYFALQLHSLHQASQLTLSWAMLLSSLWAVMLLVKKPFLNSNSKLHPQLLQ